MESFAIKNLTFAYPGRSGPALNNINLSIVAGSFFTLIGPSGCGKTTLLRMLKPSLTPRGVASGEILFDGGPIHGMHAREESSKIGFVMQNPDNQIVTDKVWHELAFGLESLGLDTQTIRLRVAEMSSFFGIQELFHMDVSELSGGQKQLICLASIMAMQPSVLILDEPTGQLDPIAAAEFLNAVGRINRELGVTVIITEHRLEEVFPFSDRIVVMEEGGIVADGAPADIGAMLKKIGSGVLNAMPVPIRVYAAVSGGAGGGSASGGCGGGADGGAGVGASFGGGDRCPVTVREGREWLEKAARGRELARAERVRDQRRRHGANENRSTGKGDAPSVEFNNVWFRYGRDRPDVLKGLTFQAYGGEITAVMGGNGTGKTTALSLLGGINRPYRGKALINGSPVDKIGSLYEGILGILPQNPQALFIRNTVYDDLLDIFNGKSVSDSDREARMERAIAVCRLEGLLDFHPYDLSGGEQQRAALAKTLLSNPGVLLLDEPTKGLDAEFKLVFAGILRELADAGATVLIVSHDVEFCAEHADRCALFFDGNAVSVNEPRAFFSCNSFYTPSANRMARRLIPDAITAGDIIDALNGAKIYDEPKGGSYICKSPKNEPPKNDPLSDPPKGDSPINDLPINGFSIPTRRRFSRSARMVLFSLLAVPVTIYAGMRFIGDRRYYLISLMVIIEMMVPFLLLFEQKKPRARDVITVSTICAIGVAGRAAFFMLPQFKPVVAITVIAGVAFGGETGFAVGALTAFVSNMFFGQGPWTPWQMFAFGLIGFLAGALSKIGLLRRGRIPLCVFGGLATVAVYGLLINVSNILTYQSFPTIQMLGAALLYGLPFDLAHAAATVFFLFAISRPMLEKLDRIKTKYGLVG